MTEGTESTPGATDDDLDPVDHNLLDRVPDEPEVAAYDLDGDGKISTVEAERARLGLLDARMDEIGHEGGVKGAIANAAHKVLDKLDND